MLIEMNEENKGGIEVFQSVPSNLEKFILPSSRPWYFQGVEFKGLFQEFKGPGFSAWWNRFWIDGPTVVNVRADIATLELRIAIKNFIRGSWDKIDNAELPPHYFQMGVCSSHTNKGGFLEPAPNIKVLIFTSSSSFCRN
ncbi:MAG: hypothetical protein WDM78_08235 [Puia sp.]